MTHKGAKDKPPKQYTHQCEGHTENTEQQIGDGKIEQKDVSHRTHRPVEGESDYDQQVAHHGEHKDDAVRQNQGQQGVPGEQTEEVRVGYHGRHCGVRVRLGGVVGGPFTDSAVLGMADIGLYY